MEALTEIGAVYVENGKINPDKSFCTFVNPGKPIPQKVVELTGINDSMVADAPTPAEAIRQFKEFCGDNILVAHNANSFDMLFIRKAGDKAGVDFSNTYIDTLPMAQALFPGLHNYKLDTINKHLEIQPFNHHRAVDDAMALARIFEVMISDLKEKDMTTVEAINTGGNHGDMQFFAQLDDGAVEVLDGFDGIHLPIADHELVVAKRLHFKIVIIPGNAQQFIMGLACHYGAVQLACFARR